MRIEELVEEIMVYSEIRVYVSSIGINSVYSMSDYDCDYIGQDLLISDGKSELYISSNNSIDYIDGDYVVKDKGVIIKITPIITL